MNSKTKKIWALVMALVMMISFMPVFTDEAYADTVITDPNGYLTSGITYRLSFEPGSQYAENVRYYNISTDLNSPSQVRLMINNIKTTNGGSAYTSRSDISSITMRRANSYPSISTAIRQRAQLNWENSGTAHMGILIKACGLSLRYTHTAPIQWRLM